MKQQSATSEMLRIISNSPVHSVLDSVAENAVRLCDSANAEIFRLENNLLQLVASHGEIPVNIDARAGLPANRLRVTGRAACDRRTIQVHDLAAEDSEYPMGSRDAKREGHHTTLATPLLREGIRRLVDANIIGIFSWDDEGRILEANEAFLQIVGYELCGYGKLPSRGNSVTLFGSRDNA